MRREPTEPERRLWLALRARRFSDVKFRRQKVIGRYIADFAAREPMLIVELDGDTHGRHEAYDRARTAELEEMGYRVIRFTNAEVMENLEGVLTAVGEALRLPPLPTSSRSTSPRDVELVLGAQATSNSPEGERA